MNLTKINYFLTVSRLGSLSAASTELHISQPTLSGAIRDLEEEYGVTLFKRHKGGMELTEEGAALFKLAADVAERAERADESMLGLGKGKKKITLGVPPMIGSICLPKIYGEFVRDNPDIEISIIEGGREELLEEVRWERIDGAFIPHDTPVDGDYYSIPIGRLETVLCAHKSNPVLNYSSISPKELREAKIVLFEDGFLHTKKIKSWFGACGVTPNIMLQTAQLSTIVSIIRENIAIGFLFREMIPAYPPLVSLPLPSFAPTDVSFILKRREYKSDAIKLFCSYIKQTNLIENCII